MGRPSVRRITASIVGSYPKPSYLKEGVSERRVARSLGAALEKAAAAAGPRKFHALSDRAVDETVRDQEEAGLDIVTDGEQRRGHFIYYVLRRLEGFDFKHLATLPDRRLIGNRLQTIFRTGIPRAAAPIRRTKKILVSDYRYLAAQARRGVKISLPGPTTVVDAVQNDFYRSAPEFAFAYADAIRKEVRALKGAGCRLFQFDDPGLLRNIIRAREWGVAALDRCFEGVTGIKTIVHVCRSKVNKELQKRGILYKSDEAYYPQLLKLLRESKIDAISIEGKHGGLNPGVLQHLGGKRVLYGCVDSGTERVETVREIVALARKALKFIRPEQLVLAPDCGLGRISQDSAKRKLKHLAQAAAVLNRN